MSETTKSFNGVKLKVNFTAISSSNAMSNIVTDENISSMFAKIHHWYVKTNGFQASSPPLVSTSSNGIVPAITNTSGFLKGTGTNGTWTTISSSDLPNGIVWNTGNVQLKGLFEPSAAGDGTQITTANGTSTMAQLGREEYPFSNIYGVNLHAAAKSNTIKPSLELSWYDASGNNNGDWKFEIEDSGSGMTLSENGTELFAFDTAGTFTCDGLSVTTINGKTVGNNPKFTDTVTTVTSDGSTGNAITNVTASNGQLTLSKGSFLPSTTTYAASDSVGGDALKAKDLSVHYYSNNGYSSTATFSTLVNHNSSISADYYAIGFVDNDENATITQFELGFDSTTGIVFRTRDKNGNQSGVTLLTQHPTVTTSTDTTSTASPAHGGTFTAVDSVTRDTNGHVTKINTKTVTLPAVPEGYTHPTYTARTGKPTTNQTPSFGETFTISQITSDTTGHVTAATDRTVKIPSLPTASTSQAGIVKLSSSTSSTSTTLAATPSAVKSVNDAFQSHDITQNYVTITAIAPSMTTSSSTGTTSIAFRMRYFFNAVVSGVTITDVGVITDRKHGMLSGTVHPFEKALTLENYEADAALYPDESSTDRTFMMRSVVNNPNATNNLISNDGTYGTIGYNFVDTYGYGIAIRPFVKFTYNGMQYIKYGDPTYGIQEIGNVKQSNKTENRYYPLLFGANGNSIAPTSSDSQGLDETIFYGTYLNPSLYVNPSTGSIYANTVNASNSINTPNVITSPSNGNPNFSLIRYNGTNLWIGAASGSADTFYGTTYISSGLKSDGTGNSTIKINVPGDTSYSVLHDGNTSFERTLTSGTAIGTLTINGTGVTLYAPSASQSSDVNVTQSSQAGSSGKFYPLLFGYSNSTSHEASALTTTVTNQAYVNSKLYCDPYNGAIYSRKLYIGTSSSYRHAIAPPSSSSSSYTYTFPAKTGTVAMTSDIPSITTTTSVTSGSSALVTSGGVYSALSSKVSSSSLGDAAYKNYTTSATSGSSNLITSGAVYTALAACMQNLGNIGSANLNNYTSESGFFKFSGASNAPNSTTGGGVGIVWHSGTFSGMFVICYDSTSKKEMCWARRYNGSTWFSWIQLGSL